MILFRKIKYKNILSTGNYFTEIVFNTNTDTLIVGENGSGKSTMLDALCFVLFGKPFRNINKPNLINTINQKDCVVEIEFDINSKSYKIIRGIKPNIFEIYQNGELINQDAASRDYQEYLENFILKLNYKSFTQIVILGSASFTPFMQLSASDRRLIIEDLLDIQIFSVMNNLLKTKLTINKDSIFDIKHNIDLSQQKYDICKKHIEDLKANNVETIQKYKSEILIHTDTVGKLNSNVSNILSQIESFQSFIVDKDTTETKLKDITKLESQIENNLSKHKKDISFFEKNDNCPTCRQTIISEFKDQEVINLNTKALECDHALQQLEIKLIEQQTKLNLITEKQKEIHALNINLATNNALITETNKYIDKLNNQILSLSTCGMISNKDELELTELDTKLSNSKNELKGLIDKKQYYEIASTLLKDTGIKTKIIRQYLPIINKMVNKYLATLDFFVNFNLDESFKETIKSRHRDDFSYNNFSEGEKQRIDISLMLTWRAVAKMKNSCNTNLLILDEIFDSSLDTNGTEEMMKILKILEGVNLFVISHRGDILQDKFTNIIRFQKIKNFSRIIK
jgi:DNA repair exonuclease SbcCD ATPase subunit